MITTNVNMELTVFCNDFFSLYHNIYYFISSHVFFRLTFSAVSLSLKIIAVIFVAAV